MTTAGKGQKQEAILAICIEGAKASESISQRMPNNEPLTAMASLKDESLRKLFINSYQSPYFASPSLHDVLQKFLDGRLGANTYRNYIDLAGPAEIGMHFESAVTELAQHHGVDLTSEMLTLLKFCDEVTQGETA